MMKKRDQRIAAFRADAEKRLSDLQASFNAAADIPDPAERFLNYLEIETKGKSEKADFMREIAKNPLEKKGMIANISGISLSVLSICATGLPKIFNIDIGMPGITDTAFDYAIMGGCCSGLGTAITGLMLPLYNGETKYNKKQLHAALTAFDDFMAEVSLERKAIPAQNMEAFARSTFFDTALDRTPELEKEFQRYAMKKKLGVTPVTSPNIINRLEL